MFIVHYVRRRLATNKEQHTNPELGIKWVNVMKSE